MSWRGGETAIRNRGREPCEGWFRLRRDRGGLRCEGEGREAERSWAPSIGIARRGSLRRRLLPPCRWIWRRRSDRSLRRSSGKRCRIFPGRSPPKRRSLAWGLGSSLHWFPLWFRGNISYKVGMLNWITGIFYWTRISIGSMPRAQSNGSRGG